MRIFRYVLLILVVFSLSCTREVEESVNISIDTSKISGGHQKANSSVSASSVLPGYYPMNVIANIHYDGRTEVVEWECPHGTPPSSCVLPPSINFGNKKFPNGSGRVAQVLLIYENAQRQLLFYYAHALGLTFNGGSINVVLNDWVNNGASPGTGTVSGRFIDLAGNGPTGAFHGSYSPPRPVGFTEEQIPDMKLFKSFMFAGHFNAMFLKGATKFSWNLVSPTGAITQRVFTQKSLDDFVGANLNSSMVGTHIVNPPYFKVHMSGGIRESHFVEAEDTVIGLFKSNPAVPGNIEYYLPGDFGGSAGFYFRSTDNGAPAVPEYVDYSYRYFDGTNLINPINYSVNAVDGWIDPTAPSSSGSEPLWVSHRLQTQTTGAVNQVRVVGGVNTDSGSCAGLLSGASNLISDYCFKIILSQATRSGIAPFLGPFAMMQVQPGPPAEYGLLKHGPAIVESPITHRRVMWKYLQDIDSTLVDGTDVLLVPRGEVENNNEKHGLDCEKFATAGYSVMLGNNPDLTPANQFLEFPNTLASSIPAAELVVCPYKNIAGVKKYYPFGISTQGFMMGPPAIVATVAAIPANLNNGSCTSYNVTLSRPSIGNTLVTVTADYAVLNSSSCGPAGTITQPLNYLNGESTKTFYIDAELNANVTIDFTISGADFYNPTIASQTTTIAAAPALSVAGLASPIAEGTCRDFTISRSITTGTINVTLPVSTGNIRHIYFTGSGCIPGNRVIATDVPINDTVPTISMSVRVFTRQNEVNAAFDFTSAGYTPANVLQNINETAVVVFTTTTTHVNTTLGTNWGDSICQSAAVSNGWPGTGWMAILSDAGVGAAARVGSLSNKAVHNTRGDLVADGTTIGTTQLFSSPSILNPIYGEDQTPVTTGYVWTGATATGGIGAQHCSDWMVNSSGGSAIYGLPNVTNSTRFNDSNATITCDIPAHLYCIDATP
jgi:hypothetical protein